MIKMLRNFFTVSHLEKFVKLVLSRNLLFIIFLGVILNLLYSFYLIDRRLGIYFLNVGQGDSILIESPDKKYILVDGGPDKSVIEELQAYLPFWKKSIDYVLITHTDADHLAGILDVLKYYEVKNLIITQTEDLPSTDLIVQLRNYIDKKNIITLDLSSDDDSMLGCCVVVDMVWVQNEKIEDSEKNINNFSKSFILKYGNFRGFFAGDLESKYEEIVAQINPGKIDLLKVGHHGSKTSSSFDFLSRITPTISVISVGKKNSYGHPSEEIISNLNKIGSKTFINYEYDKLYFKTDGKYLYYFTR